MFPQMFFLYLEHTDIFEDVYMHACTSICIWACVYAIMCVFTMHMRPRFCLFSGGLHACRNRRCTRAFPLVPTGPRAERRSVYSLQITLVHTAYMCAQRVCRRDTVASHVEHCMDSIMQSSSSALQRAWSSIHKNTLNTISIGNVKQISLQFFVLFRLNMSAGWANVLLRPFFFLWTWIVR